MLGSSTHGYGVTRNTSAKCHQHPVHWGDWGTSGVDYRYPLINSVNNYTDRDTSPAWQAVVYGKSYLGSSSSCLVRGTDYGRNIGDAQYIWGLVPSVSTIAVAMAPRNAAVDHAHVINRWELFINGQYVMPMTSLFCGSGHTAIMGTTVKAYEVSSATQVGVKMSGVRVDSSSELGGSNASSILGRVAMKGVVPRPVPVVEASMLEMGAEGGEVALAVSSMLSEPVYAVNDTMCVHDASSVWCTQSAGQIFSGGEITLNIAANTAGKPREVWVFVGHHYAQAAVVKITQLG